MTSVHSWRLLPRDLIELQIGQVDLLMAMYPDDMVLEDNSQKLLDTIRDSNMGEFNEIFGSAPTISMILNLPISVPADESSQLETLQLKLRVPFTHEGDEQSQDPPEVKVQLQQPPWMSRAVAAQLTSGIPTGEDLLSSIEHIKEAAAQHLERSAKKNAARIALYPTRNGTAFLARVWFYFPSISTRSKRDDFIQHAPHYNLTGFLYAGKPGLLCVEGDSQSIDDYMRFIKTESWGDIPAHHKKASERHRDVVEKRVFVDMTEITDTVGERRGQRANRGDMKAVEEWLVERGLGDAFMKVLM